MNPELLHHVNWLAVLAGAVAYFLLGAIWYTSLFGKKWRAYNHALVSATDSGTGAATTMAISFVFMFICSLGLALIVTRLQLGGWWVGLKLGLLTGICFAATAVHISYLYQKKPLGLHLIDALYNVAGNVIAGMIVCAWR